MEIITSKNEIKYLYMSGWMKKNIDQFSNIDIDSLPLTEPKL